MSQAFHDLDPTVWPVGWKVDSKEHGVIVVTESLSPAPVPIVGGAHVSKTSVVWCFTLGARVMNVNLHVCESGESAFMVHTLCAAQYERHASRHTMTHTSQRHGTWKYHNPFCDLVRRLRSVRSNGVHRARDRHIQRHVLSFLPRSHPGSVIRQRTRA